MRDTTGTMDHRLHAAFAWVLDRLPNRIGVRVRRWTGGRLGIGTQIVVGLGGGVLLTFGAIVIALALLRIVSARQSEVTEQHMPALVGAFDVSRLSGELVRATPRLVAATDLDALDAVRLDVITTETALRAAVAELTGAETSGGVGESVVPLVDSLLEIVGLIHESVQRRMSYRDRLQELDSDLADVSLDLQLQVEEELDDQQFFMYTGYRELNGGAAPISQWRTDVEIDHFGGLLNFKAYQNETTALIAQAIAESDLELLRATDERVQTALSDVVGALERIRAGPRARLQAAVDELEGLYTGAEGVRATRTGELEELARADELVTHSQETAAELVAGVENLVEDAEVSAQDAARRSGTLVSLGFWFMLAVTSFTIAFAVFGWKFFGERLVVRIGSLSRATRRMSKGDLEVQVQIEGNDELTDMAGALEVFRQHAVEVQRLNLVEKLAAEVQAKNDKLEDTLDNLRRTQQQVIKQEKLASLGALTAGIAHEIRNPLNFVNNFAALSTELIEELREELEDVAEGNGEVDREYVDEILNDLNTNVKKVNEHGERANRIVEGMLAHSRDEAGQVEGVDLNLMLDEYTKLAYHGMRGADSSFNVDLVKEFDPTAGEVEGIARDLSRVFLNVVTNACHATNLRRQKSGDSDYLPMVTVRTESGEDNVRVFVHDNGTGIPDEIVGKIFDPFFTTKAGTGGTGLGLSISHEIIQDHGGKLEVRTEAGEFTEFVITLPRKGPLSTGIQV